MNPPEMRDAGQCIRVRIRARHQFQQPQIARRIEKMGPEEPAPKRVAAPGGDPLDGKPARIRGYDGPRSHDRFDLFKQGVLHVQPLHHRLNHPFRFGQPVQMILEIADLNATKRLLVEKRSRFGFRGGLQSPFHGRIAGAAFPERHIQQQHLQARIGEVRGDLRAHRAGAQYGGLAKRDPGMGRSECARNMAGRCRRMCVHMRIKP